MEDPDHLCRQQAMQPVQQIAESPAIGLGAEGFGAISIISVMQIHRQLSHPYYQDRKLYTFFGSSHNEDPMLSMRDAYRADEQFSNPTESRKRQRHHLRTFWQF